MRTSKWSQACPGWRGDLAAYLVGALDWQACATVRRHLTTCPACEVEYEELVPIVNRLAMLTSATSPCASNMRSKFHRTKPSRTRVR